MIRKSSLTLDSTLSLEEWIDVGRQLFVLSDAAAWWLGDWLVYGQNRHPDRYKRALAATSLQYKTLRNYAWVAKKVDVSRRRDTLSFQHHAEVASSPPDEQELWLKLAEAGDWSVTELRRRIRAGNATRQDAAREVPRLVSWELDPEIKKRWQSAAEQAGVPLAEWIAAVLDKETGQDVKAVP